ncbi:MAG: ABC transporter ATP-binding protein [Gammaproteobacteria bacterium]|nr:MAG: ABC transporter ATP-binding protein [Gammaproteobacteria bacterium]
MCDVVSISNGHKKYHLGETTVQALAGVDLNIQQGEFVALVGPSGSGKSTLLNVCGLLDTFDTGEYQLNGIDVHKLQPQQLSDFRKDNIGFIFQSFNLFPVMSAFENIEYPLILQGIPAKDRKRQASQAIDDVGLEKFAYHMPDKLSGGQRQRVAIARALVKQPKLIIADEPTASLDTDTANQVIDLMQELGNKKGATFVVATHDERMTKRCKRVIHLIDGEINNEMV